MRTTDTLEGGLSEPVLTQYREQLLQIMKLVAGKDDKVALAGLRDIMLQTFLQGYKLPIAESAALARLASTMPSGRKGVSLLHAVVERCALQRALLLANLGTDLAPYLRAAGIGANEGFALEDENVIDPYEISLPRPNIPTLKPIHSQSATLEGSGSSAIFEEKWS